MKKLKAAEKRKVKVIEIYFEEDPEDPNALQPYPIFVLESGDVKKPRYNSNNVPLGQHMRNIENIFL